VLSARYIRGVGKEKFTWKEGVLHQFRSTLHSIKASMLIVPLATASVYAFDAMFNPIEQDSGVGETKNATQAFAAYDPGDRADMLWFLLNGLVVALRLHLLWWALMKYIKWGKRKPMISETLAFLTFFAALNGIVGIASALSSGTIRVWYVVVPADIISLTASDIISAFGHGLAICAAIKAGIISSIILHAIGFLILLFTMANLQMENETTRAIISGFVYPAAEVLLKYMYRKACLTNHEATEQDAADAAITEQAFIYISRNLEIALAKPNLYLIFLLRTRSVFMATLAMAFMCEVGGLFISNLRFTKAGQHIKARISKRKVVAANNSRSNDPTASPTADAEATLQLEKDKQELALLRNGEEISEKALILATPAIIVVMIWCGIVQEKSLTMKELGIRAAIAFALEFAVDAIKLRLDAMFGIYDHMVRNRMDVWDVVNIATIGSAAEFMFLLAVVYAQSAG